MTKPATKPKHATSGRRRPLSKVQPTSLPQPDHRAILAARLDRLADHNLHLGFHYQAERLARQAAELRGVE